MSHLRCFFILLVNLSILSSGLAQQLDRRQNTALSVQQPARIRFEHLTVADGLPENSVNCMLQDHLGFIWMGTQGGLVRYDGTQMVDFQSDLKNKYAFKGRNVQSIYEDRNGDIWIGCERLVRFERATGRFIEYPQKAPEGSRNADFIAFIHEDQRGDIWTITGNYSDYIFLLNRFNPKTATWTYFRHDPTNPHSLLANAIYLSNTNWIKDFAFLEDRSGTIWVTTMGDGNMLHRFDPKTNQFNRFQPKTSPGIAADFGLISLIAEDKQGNLYLSSIAKGLFRLNRTAGPPQTWQVTQFKHDTQNPYSIRNDSVTRVYPDRDGTVWVPTNQGLDQLDPKTGRFTHFISKPNDPNSPSPGMLQFLAETAKGDSWFVTTDGLAMYDRRRQAFVRYQKRNEPEGLKAGGNIISFLVDRIGVVWVGKADDGVYKQSRAVKFSAIMNKPDLIKQGSSGSEKASFIFRMYEAPSEPGVIWLGTDVGLDRLDRKTGHRTQYRHEDRNSQSIGKGQVFEMAEDKQGRFWVGVQGGGLNLLDRKHGTFTRFIHDSTRANSLMDDNLRAVLPASDGTLWIGTYLGLDHYDPIRQTFTHYYQSDSLYTPELYTRIQSLTTARKPVAAIRQPGNNVNQTVAFSLSQPTDLLLVVGGEWVSDTKLDYGWLEDGEGHRIWTTTYKQSAGDGLTGQIRNQISVIHLEAGRYRLRYRSDGTYAYGHWTSASPAHPQLWGIQCVALSPEEGQVVSQLARKRQFTGLHSRFVLSLEEDSQKRIWIGMSLTGGVQVLDPRTGKFTTILTDAGGLSSVQCLLPDARPGCFWVGDFTNGLWLVNDKKRVLKHFTRANGLPNNTVISVHRDKQGLLWVGTGNGLVRLDRNTDQIRHFTRRNGLQGLFTPTWCASSGEIYAGSEGDVITLFPDQAQDDPIRPPVVLTDLLINGQPATVGSDGQLATHISVAKTITLPHDQSDLTFQFAALSYNRGEESQYAFKLTPTDTVWVPLGVTRQARFLDLRPGTYTFEVKAANADGAWNEKGTSIQLTIRPPWWQTWWAYLLYTLLLGGAIWTFVQYRSRALRRENRLLEEKVAIRTKQVQQQNSEILEQKEEIAAQRDHLEQSLTELQSTQTQLIQKEKLASLGELTAGIAHEIQNPLNFVNNFSEVSAELVEELKEEALAGNTNDVLAIADDLSSNLKKINHHGGRASSIVKGMLEHSRTESGEKRPTDLNALADEYLKIAYHGLRAKDKTGFNCELVTDFDPTLELVEVAPQEIGRVLLNLYNNAFYAVLEKQKMTPANYHPTVSVSTQRSESGVEIRVQDNGTGIPDGVKVKIFQPFFTTKPTGEGTGLGLSLSYDIITKGHNGTLTVASQPGQGTTFVISLPTQA
nr:two-component regulator propeller domain-containing protein [Spirosoma arboris]